MAVAQQMLRNDARDDMYDHHAYTYLKAMDNWIHLFEAILPELQGMTFWLGIQDLVAAESEAARQCLRERFESEEVEQVYRPRIADLLARYGDMNALRYYADHIKATGLTPKRRSQPSCLGYTTQREAIPVLFELLKHSYSDAWQDSSEIDTLEQAVLVGLRTAATQNAENLKIVGDGIAEIVEELPDQAYLYTYLEQWQDQFQRQNAHARTLDEIIDVLDKIESCRL